MFGVVAVLLLLTISFCINVRFGWNLYPRSVLEWAYDSSICVAALAVFLLKVQ